MKTKNPRINVTFEKETATLIYNLAKKQHKSVASFVRELSLEALEKREDFYLSQIAAKLDSKNIKNYDHVTAWK